ncbi:MAG TPA: DUF402 domain-containing protein [Pyrinomonadaceae bacterium]|nr:DUF402 domain-containing protein [Pyrinomonadaceae bacterium]
MSEQAESTHLVTVRSCKYDGRVHRVWEASVERVEGSLIVLEGSFAEEVRHPLLGQILRGTRSTEYYWTDRWYSVFRFREPTGELRNYYCNVNAPARFDSRVLTFIDLDIDLLVAPDFSVRILDEDEFEMNAVRYAYPQEFRARAGRAVEDLLALVAGRAFPFDVSV